MTPYEILVRAFSALNPKQRANLRWHAEHGTPICCGEDAMYYSDGKGAG